MKAVIMAGGRGTRLRAVTGELPKPLVPLLGRPMIEHIIALLKKHGFMDICISLGYRAEDMARFVGDGSRFGVHICCRTEREALGTAGGVRNCADFLGEEDFLVISGDAACDLDLTALTEAHRASGAAVTAALHRSSEPLSYGLAVTDADGFIRCFIEKPQWKRVVTDLVNTGIYIVSPRALAAIPVGKSFDFANDLFPLLLARGEKLRGIALDGYWCDVGNPLSYYRCCIDALEGKLNITPGAAFTRPAEEAAEDDEDTGAAERIDCRCQSRAALMGALSEAMLDMGADYSDGIRLTGRGYTLHISPLSSRSAVRVAVSSPDSEFARSLALSAKELIDVLAL